MVRGLAACAALGVLLLSKTSSPRSPWQYFRFEGGEFVAAEQPPQGSVAMATERGPMPPYLSPEGDVSAAALADVTGDGQPEWMVLIWRPWQDWPVQRWVAAPSPVSDFRDAQGYSSHLVVIDPRDGLEVWAGSALPAPFIGMAVGDVDADGQNEVVALEGTYDAGREGPAEHLDVWGWSGFGFGLEWRSSRMDLRELCLFGAPRDGILTIGVR